MPDNVQDLIKPVSQDQAHDPDNLLEKGYLIPGLIEQHRPGSKKPTVAEQLLAWYGSNNPDDSFGVMLKNAGLLRQILNYENERMVSRGNSQWGSQRIFDIKPLPGLIQHFRMDPKRVRNGRRWTLQYGHMQGTFMVSIRDSLPIFIVSWGPSPKETMEMAIGSQRAFDLLFERLETKRKRLVTSAPPRGIWSVDMQRTNSGVITHFVRKKIEDEYTGRFMSHPMFPTLKEDLDSFFSKIEWHTRYGQPGMRKVLMRGPPGTGKTSIAMAVASQYKETHLVVYADSGALLVEAAELAAAKKRATILVCEELDMLKRPDGSTLNWLDGANTPRNSSGTYIITTTNYPKQIDPRILKRPGRIDRILLVGALRTKDAARVAQSFLGDDGSSLDNTALGKVLDRTTPAEIKEIINIALRSLNPGETLEVSTIDQARKALKQSLIEIEDDESPEMREELHQKWGPMDDIDI